MKKELVIFLLIISIPIFSFSINAEINSSITGNSIITGEATEAIMAVSISILAPPSLTIIKPENETYLTKNNLLLKYYSLAEDYVRYNLDSGSNTTIAGNTTFNTTSGTHTLYLYANNSEGGVSRNITFTVNSSRFKVYYEEYAGATKGNSINFNQSSYEDLQNLSDIILENSEYGKIEFNEAINLTDDENPADYETNISAHTDISSNRIEINTTALPNFNVSSTLYLYNLTFTNPRVLRNGVICPSNICTENSYSGGIFSFNVTEFSIYSSEETPEGEDDETPGSGGGSGTTTKTKKDFSLSAEVIKVSLKQGETTTRYITITNNGKRKIDMEIKNPLEELIILSEKEFSIEAGESKTIDLDIIAREGSIPNLYLGEMVFSAEDIGEKRILIAIEIESLESLFDISIRIPKQFKKVKPGEDLILVVDAREISRIGIVDSEINYKIMDFSENIILEETETLAIDGEKNFIKSFAIPENIKEGKYIIYVTLKYNGKIASASEFFRIKNGILSEYNFIYYLLILIGFVIIFIIYEITKIKKTHYKQKKSKEKISTERIIKKGIIRRS